MSKWKIYPDVNYYFCTSTIIDWYPLFISFNYFNILTESLAHCQREKELQIHAYVIMPNHLHLIVSSGSTTSVSDIMRDFKRYTSSEIRNLLKRQNQQYALHLFKQSAPKKQNRSNLQNLQDGFHPISLEIAHFFEQKIDYIHQNPVRKGYVVKPVHWLYSSARNYAGLQPTPLIIDCLG